jgi:hypothetical protein
MVYSQLSVSKTDVNLSNNLCENLIHVVYNKIKIWFRRFMLFLDKRRRMFSYYLGDLPASNDHRHSTGKQSPLGSQQWVQQWHAIPSPPKILSSVLLPFAELSQSA